MLATFWSEIGVPAAVFVCPTKKTLANGYVYNQTWSGASLGEIAAPTSAVLTGDGVGTGAVANVAYLPTDFELRHDKKLILSFVDGHVVLTGRVPCAMDRNNMGIPPITASLAAFYSADAITGVLSGGPVATWNNTSPTASGYPMAAMTGTWPMNPMSNPTLAPGAVNGHAAVRFNGYNALITQGSATGPLPACNYTIYIAYKSTDTDGIFINALESNTAAANQDRKFGISGGKIYHNTNNAAFGYGDTVWGSTVNDGKPHVAGAYNENAGAVAWATPPGNHFLYSDGASVTQQASFNFGGYFMPNAYLVMGTSEYSNSIKGDIAEVLMYNTVLAKGNRDALEDYLGIKYGVPVNY